MADFSKILSKPGFRFFLFNFFSAGFSKSKSQHHRFDGKDRDACQSRSSQAGGGCQQFV